MTKFPTVVVFPDGQAATLLKPHDMLDYLTIYVGSDICDMVEEMLSDFESFDEAYDSGYKDGYDSGYEDGWDDGKNAGYGDGKDE